MATATKTKTRNRMGGASGGLMGLAGRPKAKKTASKTPVIKIADERTSKLIAKLIKTKREAKEKNSACKIIEGELMDKAHELRINQCMTDRTVHKTVKLSGSMGFVSFTQKSQFIDMEQAYCEDHLVAELGEKAYKKYFTVEQILKINVNLLSQEQQTAILDVLVEALGDDADNILDPVAKITPTDAWVHDCIFDPRIKASSDKLRGNSCEVSLVEPHKASFRV